MSEHPNAAPTDTAGILGRGRRALYIVVAVLVIGVVFSLVRNTMESRALAMTAGEHQTPTVNVITAAAGGPAAQVELPGAISAFNEAPILARTTGYVRRWNAELGAKGAAGAPLVENDAPDLDQELAQSRAALLQTRASLEVARKASARWQELRAADAVSQQEADDRAGSLAELEAAAKAAAANVSRLEELARFKSVAAPFAGVIVKRDVEIGQLVSAGSGRSVGGALATPRLLGRLRRNCARQRGRRAALATPAGMPPRAAVLKCAGRRASRQLSRAETGTQVGPRFFAVAVGCMSDIVRGLARAARHL